MVVSGGHSSLYIVREVGAQMRPRAQVRPPDAIARIEHGNGLLLIGFAQSSLKRRATVTHR